jgi:hypothetical protein
MATRPSDALSDLVVSQLASKVETVTIPAIEPTDFKKPRRVRWTLCESDTGVLLFL